MSILKIIQTSGRYFSELIKENKADGVFGNRASIERILYALFPYENIPYGVHYVFGCWHKIFDITIRQLRN
ncbi:MAG: hypothetical protein N2745_10850 [Syntrophorhabdaceae bacterium]|nr:hypothetical protein [Syntrophorhabdaceae bacterium]